MQLLLHLSVRAFSRPVLSRMTWLMGLPLLLLMGCGGGSGIEPDLPDDDADFPLDETEVFIDESDDAEGTREVACIGQCYEAWANGETPLFTNKPGGYHTMPNVVGTEETSTIVYRHKPSKQLGTVRYRVDAEGLHITLRIKSTEPVGLLDIRVYAGCAPPANLNPQNFPHKARWLSFKRNHTIHVPASMYTCGELYLAAFITACERPGNWPPSAVATLSKSAYTSGEFVEVLLTDPGDSEGHKVKVKADWENDGSYVQVAEIRKPYPATFEFSSPMSVTFSGTDPDMRTLKLRLKDGAATVALPPLVYQVLPIEGPPPPPPPPPNEPPSATYTIDNSPVDEGETVGVTLADFADPEGNDIAVEVDWLANNTWTPAGTFASPYPAQLPLTSPMPYLFAGLAPDVRSLPVRISDGGNMVTLMPVQTFEVRDPIQPITTDWTTFSGMLGTTWQLMGGGDYASWRTTAFPGWITQMGDSLVRFDWQPPNAQSVTPMTTPLAGLLPGHAYDIDTDVNNRVFYTTTTGLIASGFIQCSPSQLYGAGITRATAGIRWFDYAGSLVSSVNTIATARPVIHFTVTHAGSVLYVDDQSVLHKLDPSGSMAYVEQLGGGFPANLGASGTVIPAGLTIDRSGTPSRRVHDLAVDDHTGVIYLLVEGATAQPRGRLYRLEPDGTFVTYGGANPRAFDLNPSLTTFGLTAQVAVDNYSATGALLTGQQRNQILVTSVGQTRIFSDSPSAGMSLMETFALPMNGFPYANVQLSRKSGLQVIENRRLLTGTTSANVGVAYGPPQYWK